MFKRVSTLSVAPPLRRCQGLMLAAAAVTFLAMPGLAQERASAQAAWSKEELVERLDRHQARTRGLTPLEGSAAVSSAAAMPSVPDLKITFAFNSAEITPEAQTQLDVLAEALVTQNLAGDLFEIAGHTDAHGDEVYNEYLSEARAQAVVDYLTTYHGVSAARLQSRGYGELQLYDPANPGGGVNRRVEVRNLGP